MAVKNTAADEQSHTTTDVMTTSCWRRAIYAANVVGAQSPRMLSTGRIASVHLVTCIPQFETVFRIKCETLH